MTVAGQKVGYLHHGHFQKVSTGTRNDMRGPHVEPLPWSIFLCPQKAAENRSCLTQTRAFGFLPTAPMPSSKRGISLEEIGPKKFSLLQRQNNSVGYPSEIHKTLRPLPVLKTKINSLAGSSLFLGYIG